MGGYDLGMYPRQRADGIDLYSRSSREDRVPGNSGGQAFFFPGDTWKAPDRSPWSWEDCRMYLEGVGFPRAFGALSLEVGNEAREEGASMAQSYKMMAVRHITLLQVGHTHGDSCWRQCLEPFGAMKMSNTSQGW